MWTGLERVTTFLVFGVSGRFRTREKVFDTKIKDFYFVERQIEVRVSVILDFILWIRSHVKEYG